MKLEKLLEKLGNHHPVLTSKQIRVRSLVFFFLGAVTSYLCYFVLQVTGDLYIILVLIPLVLFGFGFYALITGKLPKA